MVGVITTIMNHKLKKPLNNPEVVDTQGTLYTFFIASLFGAFYSACLATVTPYGADVATVATNSAGLTSVVYSEDSTLKWLGAGRDRFEQGGFQVLGTVVSAAVGVFAGLAVGAFYAITTALETEEIFNDASFAEVGDEG